MRAPDARDRDDERAVAARTPRRRRGARSGSSLAACVRAGGVEAAERPWGPPGSGQPVQRLRGGRERRLVVQHGPQRAHGHHKAVTVRVLGVHDADHAAVASSTADPELPGSTGASVTRTVPRFSLSGSVWLAEHLPGGHGQRAPQRVADDRDRVARSRGRRRRGRGTPAGRRRCARSPGRPGRPCWPPRPPCPGRRRCSAAASTESATTCRLVTRVWSSSAKPDPVDRVPQPMFRMRTAIRCADVEAVGGAGSPLDVGVCWGRSVGTTPVGTGAGSSGSSAAAAGQGEQRERRPAADAAAADGLIARARAAGRRWRRSPGAHTVCTSALNRARSAGSYWSGVLQVADEPLLAVDAAGQRGRDLPGRLRHARLVVGELLLRRAGVAELRLLVGELRDPLPAPSSAAPPSASSSACVAVEVGLRLPRAPRRVDRASVSQSCVRACHASCRREHAGRARARRRRARRRAGPRGRPWPRAVRGGGDPVPSSGAARWAACPGWPGTTARDLEREPGGSARAHPGDLGDRRLGTEAVSSRARGSSGCIAPG